MHKLFLVLILWAIPTFAVGPWILTVRDSINPGSGAYLEEMLTQAEKKEVPFVVIELDTPGGLVTTTRAIIQKMLNSPIPVVIFVGPKGAQAASAGAFITLASDVAIMAPGTNIGAAHPVQVGGDSKTDKTMDEKITNDLTAYAESLAKTKSRNREWAQNAVRKSISTIAEEALNLGVIDFMAESREQAFEKLKGWKLKTPKGKITQLPETWDAPEHHPMQIKYKAVSFFSDPNMAYLVMSIGALCLWIELSTPGLILPGIVGALCLLLSLISFQLMPISYGALALLFVGLGMIFAEFFLPTYGVLGVGGSICFLLGSVFLIDDDGSGLKLSLKMILPTALILLSAILAMGFVLFRSRKTKSRSGLEALVGLKGRVLDPPTKEGAGILIIEGELWKFHSEKTIEKNQPVIVKAVNEMVLVVEPTDIS